MESFIKDMVIGFLLFYNARIRSTVKLFYMYDLLYILCFPEYEVSFSSYCSILIYLS